MEKFKVLVVTIKSATLKAKYNKAKIYAYAYVQPEARLRTKVHQAHTTWDDKLVFSIPESSLKGQDRSFVFFKIYKKRWGGAPDSLIGIAKCDVVTLLAACLDSSSNPSESILNGFRIEDYCFEEDPRYPNMFEEKKKENFEEDKKEFKASTCVEILKGSKKKGVLEVELEMGESICCLGKFPWKNMAMPYDAFIGKPIEAKKQNKKSLHWVCYGSATATI